MRLIATLIAACLPCLGWGASEPLRYVASQPILEAWVRDLAGGAAEVTSLTPREADLHVFEPSPQTVRRLLEADAIIGMDPLLEPWLARLISSNHLEGKVLWIGKPWISDQGNTLACCPEEGGGKHALLRRPQPVDPHIWTDPELVRQMLGKLHTWVETRLGPGGAANRQAALATLLAETEAVDRELQERLGGLPPERRGLITHHANLGRFAGRYGLRIEGVILASATTEAADPSAREMARLIATARAGKARLIVVDKGQRAAAAEVLAKEARLPPPLPIRIDNLEREGPGATWAGMMREAGRRLAEGLER